VAASSSTTPNTGTTGQTSSGGVSEKRNEETKTKELPEKSKVTHIELVESGSEDGEIVEVDEVDSETQGKHFILKDV
jgi:hypothetical protein